jgi:D-alanyl-lipoteichoic acid acyltransferase DltB (MBOAT superfamily)
MLFNSIDLAIFLPVVFILYWFVLNKNLKTQDLLIVVSSYVFSGWWDWRFLFLILLSSLVNYTLGCKLLNEKGLQQRKILLWISLYPYQTLNDTVDFYKEKPTATKGFIDFNAFVSFFSQLVAGPIERATNLLPYLSGTIHCVDKNPLNPIGIKLYNQYILDSIVSKTKLN